jgi:hypothetical protein
MLSTFSPITAAVTSTRQLLALLGLGCALVCGAFLIGRYHINVPATLGEQSRELTYGYTPLDPIPVGLTNDANSGDILRALPDETMRLAIGLVEGNGSISYGPAKVGYAGSNYIVVLDYIKYTTQSFGVIKERQESDGTKTNWVYALAGPNTRPDATVPVYVGIGLRLTANITVNQGNLNLGNLVAVGAAAEASKVAGTLVIQSLGISGEGVSSAIPIPSEINTTTIQNALMAMGTIKSHIYGEKTLVSPRVLAVYNNLGGGASTVNGFISLLLQQPVTLPVTTKNHAGAT